MANFKIALTAGHYKYTSGKNCWKSLDPNETREWVLNDRIADKVEKLLAANYIGYELIRTDDTTGEKAIELDERVAAANNFNADFYLSIHHNAGIKGGKGGGIVAYVYTHVDNETIAWQKAMYNALIEATGLKGNRANPLPKSNLYECRMTKMPAVLLELGFMDSATDVPIILTEEYADKCAAAIVKVLAERGKLEKKSVAPPKIAKGYAEYDQTLAGEYTVNAENALNVRTGAGTDNAVLVTIKKGAKVQCNGCYSTVSGVKWLHIQFTYNGVKYMGLASSQYLKK